MSRADLDALAPVRRHREAQAERAWRQQRDLLREREAAVAAAQVRWQAASEQQVTQREALYGEHRGRALSVCELNAWSTEERRLIGELAEQAQALQALDEEQAQQARSTEAARQRLQRRRRDLEKLSAMMDYLVEDPSDE
ncbi:MULTISPECIES: hypothetical protein [Pseudomonas]|jgi:hypothetical protein|uniref:hypothetical protein n=1 Tax=Pseudomonas TaxID=286 RepID=UPI0018E5AD7D|nr:MULTISPECIES: hypothetical protein [Pseudomonas]MBI6617200.1 hypothetical protein [Pseudomonas corrugata]MBI6691752.1 hypothetical protein [Pseudomonas corrugata]WRV68181.1 hypothetical protein VQ575_25515 [Pseudomonas frederiksbergensis]